jgi:hypothetical protein
LEVLSELDLLMRSKRCIGHKTSLPVRSETAVVEGDLYIANALLLVQVQSISAAVVLD